MRRWMLPLAAIALVALAAVGLARSAAPTTEVSAAARVDEVASTLRCPTCQGLSVADSPSKVADSMRDIISEQLAAGRSPEQVKEWFVDRYGEWILLSPSPAGLGWLIWVLPAVTIVAGVGAASVVLRGRRRASPGDANTAAVADKLVEAHARGTLAVPDTAAGERLESALSLVHAVRADQRVGLADSGAERLALTRVAEAYADVQRERSAPLEKAGEYAVSSPSLWQRVPKAVRWAGLAGIFLIALTGALTTGITQRGSDGPLTGQPAQVGLEPQDDAQIARLRDEIGRDPDNVQLRLRLAAALLQAGRPTAAAREADNLLARNPDNLDAMLLSGVARMQSGDRTGEDELRTFLDTAPQDHPGLPLARDLLEEPNPTRRP